MYDVVKIDWHDEHVTVWEPEDIGSYCIGYIEMPFDSVILMQYTGLKDKNGKEIYEGDVVRWDDASKGKYWRIGQVAWDKKGQWKYQIIQERCVNCVVHTDFGLGSFIYTPDSTRYGNVLEVIGNIHENPELLEKPCPKE
jgi:uncharacterized phage protein (TIGR01671 family)